MQLVLDLSWNAPLDDPDHIRNASIASLEMRKTLVSWNQKMVEESKTRGESLPAIHIGIGINTGNCSVGNFGSAQRFDYSVLGDEVNLASRLEGLSKLYGVDNVIGENTNEHLEDLATLELDLIQVKGKTQAVHVFALLGDQTLKNKDYYSKLIEYNQQMLNAYRSKNWALARESIQKCLDLDTAETRLSNFYELYKMRISEYEANPPGPDWDGTTVALTK